MKVNTKRTLASVAFSVLIVGAVAVAGRIEAYPFGFSAGGTIKASEMTANFDAVKVAVNDSQDKIDALTTKVSGGKLIKKVVSKSFPAENAFRTQETILDVPLLTAPTKGAVEFSFRFQSNAFYSADIIDEVFVYGTPVLNGVKGTEEYIFGKVISDSRLDEKRAGSIAFNVNAGDNVAVSIRVVTGDACRSGMGASSTCTMTIRGLGKFDPGYVFE